MIGGNNNNESNRLLGNSNNSNSNENFELDNNDSNWNFKKTIFKFAPIFGFFAYFIIEFFTYLYRFSICDMNHTALSETACTQRLFYFKGQFYTNITLLSMLQFFIIDYNTVKVTTHENAQLLCIIIVLFLIFIVKFIEYFDTTDPYDSEYLWQAFVDLTGYSYLILHWCLYVPKLIYDRSTIPFVIAMITCFLILLILEVTHNVIHDKILFESNIKNKNYEYFYSLFEVVLLFEYFHVILDILISYNHKDNNNNNIERYVEMNRLTLRNDGSNELPSNRV